MTSIKCIVVGDGGVGKTSMLMSYALLTFPVEYVPTVFDSYAVSVEVAGVGYQLCLFDTAGQEDYDRLRPLSYHGADVFLLCFSVVSPNSWENVTSKWLPELRYYNLNTPIILVGTQSDLRENATILANLKKDNGYIIEAAEATRFAKRHRLVEYIECSALTQRGLNMVFCQAIMASVGQVKAKKKKKCIINWRYNPIRSKTSSHFRIATTAANTGKRWYP